MNKTKTRLLNILLISFTASILSACQSGESNNYPQDDIDNPEETTPNEDAEISIVQNVFNTSNGSYEVFEDELNFSSTLSSKEGCLVELLGDEKSGMFFYTNDEQCSDEDKITLSTKSGLTKSFDVYPDGTRCSGDNDWLNAAINGYKGLKYNYRSCSINGSTIWVLGSFDNIPASWLRGVYIDLFGDGGNEGEEGEGEFEGQDEYMFKMPDVKYNYGDLVVKHPFITKFDFSSLFYSYSNISIANNAQIEEIDLSRLTGNTYNLDVSYNFLLSNLDISSMQYAYIINISNTAINDISSFSNLRSGAILTDGITLTTFPNKNSTFCSYFNSGSITIDDTVNFYNAIDACNNRNPY